MYSNELITLRPFEPADAKEYRNWVNRADYATLLGRAMPVSEAQHLRWYESIHQRDDAVFFSVERNSDRLYLGNVWLWNIHWVHRNAELRILFGRDQTPQPWSG